MATSVSQFRERFPKFDDTATDSQVQIALTDAALLMNENQWGRFYDVGQAFLAAHFLAYSTGKVGTGGGSAGPLSQATTGPLSVSYGIYTASSSYETYLGSTTYGQRYQGYRDSVGMSNLVV